MERTVSGVGVLDKSVAVLDAVGATPSGASLADVMAATALPKATAHRLAAALEAHGLLRRLDDGRYGLGLRLVGLGRAAAAGWPLAEAARPVLEHLRDQSGESAQLYVREGDARRCILSLESPQELRTIVTEGAVLPLGVGSAGRVLTGAGGSSRWVSSVEERAKGVASVSAAVVVDGEVVAAVGVSGPADRLGPDPGARFGVAVADAAERIADRFRLGPYEDGSTTAATASSSAGT
jgi:DNA-binding IclR family transcriptional regulator